MPEMFDTEFWSSILFSKELAEIREEVVFPVEDSGGDASKPPHPLLLMPCTCAVCAYA